MKIGRILGYVLTIVLFCVGMLVYSIHASTKNIVSDQLIGSTIDEVLTSTIDYSTEKLLNELPENIKEQVSGEIEEHLPKEIQNELESVKENIAKDPQVLALSQKYMEAIVASSVDEDVALPDINKDIEEIIEVNFPKVADAVGTTFTQAEISAFAVDIAKDVNAQQLLEKGISTIRSNITPQQRSMIEVLSFVQSQNSMFIGIGCMCIAIVGFALLKKSTYKWMSVAGIFSILGGVILLVIATFANMFLGDKLQGMNAVISTVFENVISSVYQSGMLFSILGILSIFLYFIIKFIANRIVIE